MDGNDGGRKKFITDELKIITRSKRNYCNVEMNKFAFYALKDFLYSKKLNFLHQHEHDSAKRN